MGVIFLSPDLDRSPPRRALSRHSSQVSTREGNKYLRLKSGVSLTPHKNEYLLGLPNRGLLLTDRRQVQIARACDGSRSVHEIAAGLFCEIGEVQSFAQILREEGLLEELHLPLARDSTDLSAELIQHRSSIEKSLITHRPGSSDGGEQEFEARQEATILISGENRLARNLMVALQASGFTNTRLITRGYLAPRIVSNDVCGLVVRNDDLGKLRSEFTSELIRSAQISRSQIAAKPKPDLIISTIPIEWDYVQRWMSEGSAHLHINPLIGPEIEVGPLVLPGKTPCLRCITLLKRDNGTRVDREFVRAELPSAALAYISGLIALNVGDYFATGISPLRAASYWYDLLNPMRPPEVRHWNFHPQCGCQ